MATVDPKLRALLKQGERAIRLGKKQAAEDVYRKAIDEFPRSAEAWFGLSQVATTEWERDASAQRASELDPTLVDSQPADPAPSPADMLDAAAAESGRWLQQVTDTVYQPPPPKPAPVAPVVAAKAPAPAATQEHEVCFYHPTTETALRCNRCDKPICTRCAIKTPVGYRCKVCIKDQQEVFYTAVWHDYLLAAVVSIPLAALASYIIFSIGWLTLIVAPFAGTLIAEAARLVTRRRRGRWLPLTVTLCVTLGSLPGIAVALLPPALLAASGQLGGLPLGDLFWQLVYVVLAASTAYYRLK